MGATWFQGAGLGLFIHYGHYAAAGWEASWPLVGGVKTLPLSQRLPVDVYHANAGRFAPAQGAPERWVAAAAKAGARYAVLTAKHHDGFALWPSRAPGAFGVSAIGLWRDIVGEFVAACRTHGLKVGLYYSLSDWRHPDYPAFAERHKPYAWGRNPTPSAEQWARFQAFLRTQLTELLTDYGPIDLVWFDGGWERSPEQWDVAGLEAMIRTLQPNVLINDRLPTRGDFATPEQFVPAVAPEGLWEACMTMNRSWGYNAEDDQYKSAAGLVHALCETVGRGGNLLLNVGPMGDGTIPGPQAERLEAIAGWMGRHAEAIQDCDTGLEPWRFYGPSTRKGNRIFCFVLTRPFEPVVVRGLPLRRVRGVRALGTGAALDVQLRAPVLEELFSAEPIGEAAVTLPVAAQDPLATVIEITVEAS